MDSPKTPVTDRTEAGHLSGAPQQRHPSLAVNLVWRAAANWSSQLVSWGALLVVVRLLNPSDFGIVGMSMVLYSYLRFLGGFGITPTVIRHRGYSEDTLAQLNTMGGVFGTGSFLLACLFAWPAAVFFKSPHMAPVAIVTCLALIPLGLRSVPEGLMNTDMRFKSLSVLDALRDVVSAVVTIVLAWFGFHYWALVLGNLLSEIARCAIILRIRPYRFAWPRMATVRGPLIFGGRVLISGFAWSTYNTLDNVTAGRVLGQSALGLYGMAWTIANTPLEKVVSLVTTLIPAYLSRVQTDIAALRRYVRSITEAIALATFPTTIGIALVAGEAIPLVMGVKWSGMVAPLQVLCVYGAVRSIVALLPKVLTAVGNARFVMCAELAGLFLMPVAFWIGSHWGITGIAYGWVFAYPVIAIAEFWKTVRTIEMRVSDYVRSLRPALDGCAAMIAAVLLLKRLIPSSQSAWHRLFLEIGCGVAVYVAALLLLHRERTRHYLNIAKRMRGPKLETNAGVA
ncbi:MAG TPA: lipopolysaccharide biosynthesis protein [Candidatus Sulfotelmatobacter sp.]|nr:lipopolysaccharide biosynthesis protein [Candidatus Sulfotelmatobacter sp.]